MEHVEKDLSNGVTVAVVGKKKEELGVEEVYLGRIGVKMADAGIDGVEDVRTVDVGAFIV
jgi:hypothetical protein